MELWQREQINQNLPSLIKDTICHVEFLAILKAKGVLADIDVQQVAAKDTNYGRASLLYDILQSRANGYTVLTQALIQTNQSGATEVILKAAVANLQVEFLGNICKLEELLDDEHIKGLAKWLQTNVSTEKPSIQCENLFKPGTILQLIKNTIPKPDPFYIQRILIRRLCVDPALFEKDCEDIFVFKMVKREQLRDFLVGFGIEKSTEVIKKLSRTRKIKCRFILLTEEKTHWDSHWGIFCTKTTSPMHLIRFESETREFLLEKSTRVSKILQQHLQHRANTSGEFISENNFIEISTHDDETKGICICDSPGMGKSLLLANFARNVNTTYPNKIVAFIELRHLNVEPEISYREIVLKHISTSKFGYHLLVALSSKQKPKFVLFFDGLDEVRSENFELVTTFLGSLTESMPEAQIFITSRPVVRLQLEKAMQTISYDILPFDENTQLEFINSIWTKAYPTCNFAALSEYASKLVSKLTRSLKEREKDIAGVPLQCKMIADAFVYDAVAYADSPVSLSSKQNDFENFTFSLLEVYSKYIKRQLGETECSYHCMKKPNAKESKKSKCDDKCFVKSLHVWQALQLIFPKTAEKICDKVSEFSGLTFHQIFSPEIFQTPEEPTTGKYEFVHRTFAEYLVAEYISKGDLTGLAKEGESMMQWTLEEVFLPMESNMEGFFVRGNVVAYFLNAFIEESGNIQKYIYTSPCRSLSSEFICRLTVCLRWEYDELLEIITNPSNFSKSTIWLLSEHAMAAECLCVAAKYGSSSTIKKLFQFYYQLHKLDLIKETSTDYQYAYDRILDLVIVRADYEVVLLFVETMSLKDLKTCVQHTYFEDDELVEKRLDIARLLLRKFPPKCQNDTSIYLDSLCSLQLHPKVINFLVENGTNILVQGGRLIHNAAGYMSEDDFTKLCRSVFVGRPVEDLLAVLSKNRKIEFKFDSAENKHFFHSAALYFVLQLLNTEVAVISEEHVNLVWEKILPDVMTKPFSPIFRLKYYMDFTALLRIGLEEGHVPVVNFMLHQNIGSDEQCITVTNAIKKVSVFLSVKNEIAESFEDLVSKVENVMSANDNTIFQLVTGTDDLKIYDRVVDVLQDLESQASRRITNELESTPKTGSEIISIVMQNLYKLEIIQNALKVTKLREYSFTEDWQKILNILLVENEASDLVERSVVGSIETKIQCDSLYHEMLTMMKWRPYNQTVAFIALRSKQVEMFEQLVSNGENILPVVGWTVFQAAAETKDLQVFHRFLEILEKVLVKPSQNHLHSSSNSSCVTTPCKFVQSFLNAAKSPLHYACQHLDLPEETLDLLLNFGKQVLLSSSETCTIDINAVDKNGETALMYALKHDRSLDFVKLMVNRGASWTMKSNNGTNVIHICACRVMLEHLKYFAELGCDLNEIDNAGSNALQICVSTHNHTAPKIVEMLEYFITAGLDLQYKNHNGVTTFDIATGLGFKKSILELLKPK